MKFFSFLSPKATPAVEKFDLVKKINTGEIRFISFTLWYKENENFPATDFSATIDFRQIKLRAENYLLIMDQTGNKVSFSNYIPEDYDSEVRESIVEIGKDFIVIHSDYFGTDEEDETYTITPRHDGTVEDTFVIGENYFQDAKLLNLALVPDFK